MPKSIRRPEYGAWAGVAEAIKLDLDHDATTHAADDSTWWHASVSNDELQRIRAQLQQERAPVGSKFQTMVEKALDRPAAVRPQGRPASPPTAARDGYHPSGVISLA